ncbi:hypothetical protein JCM10207_003443 [Rhodosporidiobolus poonsookiae]
MTGKAPRKSSTKGRHIVQVNPLPKGQSCATCRVRKVRCSGEKPACRACLRTARFEGRDLKLVVCQYDNKPCSAGTKRKEKKAKASGDMKLGGAALASSVAGPSGYIDTASSSSYTLPPPDPYLSAAYHLPALRAAPVDGTNTYLPPLIAPSTYTSTPPLSYTSSASPEDSTLVHSPPDYPAVVTAEPSVTANSWSTMPRSSMLAPTSSPAPTYQSYPAPSGSQGHYAAPSASAYASPAMPCHPVDGYPYVDSYQAPQQPLHQHGVQSIPTPPVDHYTYGPASAATPTYATPSMPPKKPFNGGVYLPPPVPYASNPAGAGYLPTPPASHATAYFRPPSSRPIQQAQPAPPPQQPPPQSHSHAQRGDPTFSLPLAQPASMPNSGMYMPLPSPGLTMYQPQPVATPGFAHVDSWLKGLGNP